MRYWDLGQFCDLVSTCIILSNDLHGNGTCFFVDIVILMCSNTALGVELLFSGN